jgi:hypothetical protein
MKAELAPSRIVSVLRVALITGILLIPSVFAVTHQSLWIDEASSCWFADHAHGLNPSQFQGLGAVPEMPAFHLLLVAWVRFFGDSERALRAINLPFAVLFLASIVTLCYKTADRWWWMCAVPFAVFPMLTYYVNECRPYTALLGLSAAAGTAFFLHLQNGSRKTAWCCSLFCLAAFSMHLLGILAAFVCCLWALLVLSADGQRKLSWKKWAIPIVVTIPGYLALLAYYVRVKGEGIPSSSHSLNPDTPGNLASTWKNVVFFLYETFGFGGLGPPRNDLRIHPSIHSFSGYSAAMFVGVLACAALFLWIFRLRGRSERQAAGMQLLICSGIGLCFLFLIARASHFGFFGRHGIVLTGMICCSIVLAISGQATSHIARVSLVILLSLSWLLSSYRLLFVYPYGKDDVRSALRAASNTGLPILWNAGPMEAAYYGGFDPEESGAQTFKIQPRRGTHWQPRTVLKVLPDTTQAGVDRIANSLSGGRYALVMGKEDAFDASGFWRRTSSAWHPVLLNRLNGVDVWMVTVPSPKPFAIPLNSSSN